MQKKRFQHKKKYVIIWILGLFALLYISPLIITFTNSFMCQNEVKYNYSTVGDIMHPGKKYIDVELVPEKISISQYLELLLESPVYLNMFWNSVKIVLPVVIGQLVISSMAAYAFTVLNFKGKEVVYFVYIIVMLLPLQVTLMPNYIMAEWLGIEKSYLAIILSGVFNPFGTFLLRQSMKMIPDAYIESAKMDGAGHFNIFISVVLPMIKSGLVATAMLTIIEYWNLIDQAVIFIGENEKQPLSMFLASINSEQIGVSFVGACFYAFPILVILLFGQDYLKDGIKLSGMKG